MGRLSGKAAVITGAGRGIGRAYALAMAAEGARIVVNDLGVDVAGRGSDTSTAETVVAEIRRAGGTAIASHDDVSDPEAAERLVQESLAAFGAVDALVNNAAIEHRGSIEQHSAADWSRVMAVNAGGTFNCVRAAVAPMREQGGGAILNTTSGAFWEGTEGVAAYAASKAAVFSLTLTQHAELAPLGIRSYCIAPNATRTRMLEEWLAQLAANSGKTEQDVLAEYGIQPPENLAPLAILLCSDAGIGVSGGIFEVWGERIHRVAPPQRGPAIRRKGDAWDIEALAGALLGG